MTPDWVDHALLAGPDDEVCLWFAGPVRRSALRAAVAERHAALSAAGLRPGGTLALRLPPSPAYVECLLAAWRVGAQVLLLDHRLTPHEVDDALARLEPQLLVRPLVEPDRALRGHHDAVAVAETLAGRPTASEHALVQLSSGSTGPSKVIGRSAVDLVAELERYAAIDGMPARGDRIVVLNSLAHTFGLVGALLHGLHVGARVVVPERTTVDGILDTLAAGSEPTTLFCVPFHLELLARVAAPPVLPLVRAITGGELIRPGLAEAFTSAYGVPLGECYGMTELGVIAMDTAGTLRPSVGPPAPGVEVRVDDGELLVRAPANPYLGPADPERWSAGWLRTRDAATVVDGRVTVLGRLDSQVSVGGLKVDLSEVEHTVAALPGVTEAVVVHDRGIEAFVALAEGVPAGDVERDLAARLAPFKRPRRVHVLAALPRTSSGKCSRDPAALRAATQR
ncbi:AMP-dependent synthetase [Longispora fulva]|uniref:Acyl-coenzyme A synthetase/AMP-(Fatty) acid ligase n=1 Tax=Longispora fulva TaxID=619741 RepID=A0A8J7GPE1_9ACTN|nr:class I adenylate-forming enzyme family protein [Longispora fulva]MBG6141520.1 acyl-coenzyme A synthetase/AMP-(fatty) acid ligase [Longispora fulva]GIG59329.1 AMP-dependent synthetase [Longispora fulva]